MKIQKTFDVRTDNAGAVVPGTVVVTLAISKDDLKSSPIRQAIRNTLDEYSVDPTIYYRRDTFDVQFLFTIDIDTDLTNIAECITKLGEIETEFRETKAREIIERTQKKLEEHNYIMETITNRNAEIDSLVSLFAEQTPTRTCTCTGTGTCSCSETGACTCGHHNTDNASDESTDNEPGYVIITTSLPRFYFPNLPTTMNRSRR